MSKCPECNRILNESACEHTYGSFYVRYVNFSIPQNTTLLYTFINDYKYLGKLEGLIKMSEKRIEAWLLLK